MDTVQKRFPTPMPKISLRRNDVDLYRKLVWMCADRPFKQSMVIGSDEAQSESLRRLVANGLIWSDPSSEAEGTVWLRLRGDMPLRGLPNKHTPGYAAVFEAHDVSTFDDHYRLMPFLINCLTNDGVMDISKVSPDEYSFLLDLDAKRLIRIDDCDDRPSKLRISTSKEFFLFLCEIAYHHYVETVAVDLQGASAGNQG